MDIKKNLRTYMQNFPGSFVGFFELVSDILKDLGSEWAEYATTNQDLQMKEWSTVILNTSKSIKEVSLTLSKVRSKYDKRENASPSDLIKNFKEKIMKEIKDG